MVNKVEAEKYKTVGNNHFKNGKYAAAIEQYKLAIEQDPNNPAYWYVIFVVVCWIRMNVDVAVIENSFVYRSELIVCGEGRLFVSFNGTPYSYCNDYASFSLLFSLLLFFF